METIGCTKVEEEFFLGIKNETQGRSLGMKIDAILKELMEVAQSVGVTIRKEVGILKGGYCTLNDNKLIIISKNMPVESMVSVIARNLATIDLESVFIKPAVRAVIEKERKGHTETIVISELTS